MTAADLSVGDKVVYQDSEERVEAMVQQINNDTQEILFIDLDDFEWQERFDAIPQVVVRKLNR